MKVCLITPLFKPWNLGGAEIYAEVLVRELSQENEVIVITTIGPEPRNSKNTNKNIRIIEFNPKNISTMYNFATAKKMNIFKNLFWRSVDLWNYSSYLKIKKILAKEKPDIVQTNGIRGFSPSIFKAIKTLNIPHVHILHDYSLITQQASSLFRNERSISILNFFDKIYCWHMKRMSSAINTIISPSKYLMELHTTLGYFKKSKKFIIPHGCRLVPNTIPKTENKKNFVFIGQLLETKGILLAVKAFQKIENQEARFHIIGKGPLKDRIQNEIKNDNRIIFHGYIPLEKMQAIIEKCSFLIIPSIWPEPFGLVIHEGMSYGLPVIGSNIGAIPELVKNNINGFLFEAGNIDSLFKILDDIVKDKYDYRALSSNAIKSSTNFSIEKQMNSHMDVYKKMINI